MSFQLLKEKLIDLKKEFKLTQESLEELFLKETQPSHKSFFCYFTNSIILNHFQTDHLIMGNFHIKNMTSHTMKFPVILLKIDSNTGFNFTGKYKSSELESNGYNFQWERIEMEDLDSETHYCFRPTQTNQLLPNEQLSFQSFQIIIPEDADIQVQGFTYFNENNDGIPAINSIDISI